MNRVFLLFLLPLGLFAESAPQVTTTAGWTFETADQLGAGEWKTGETVFAGLTARWGGDLTLSGRLESDFLGDKVTADNVLGEMALTWNVNSFAILTAGKQRLSWGTARVFSAVDSLEPPLDPLDPEAKPRGVTGLRTEILPLDWLSLWFLVLPAPRLDDAVLATKLDILWEETDLSLGVVRSVSKPLIGQSGSVALRERRETPTFFANFARFFDRFGFYGEAQVRQSRNQEWLLEKPAGSLLVTTLGADPEWTLKATGGVQIEIPVWLNGTLRWLTEYHYNGDGFNEPEVDDFRAAWNQAHSPPTPTAFTLPAGLSVGTFRRHYVYTGLSGFPVTEKLSLGASAIAGIDGGLMLLSASASWELSPSLSAGVSYDHFDVWNGEAGRSELLFLPSRNRVSASLSAWY